MIKQCCKLISLCVLATQGAIGASQTALPELPISSPCRNYFKTDIERALGVFCLSATLSDLQKTTDNSRRQVDEIIPGTELERDFKKKSLQFLDSTDGMSFFIQKKCKPFRKKVPEDCQGEFSQMMIDASISTSASASANENATPHLEL
tara:strand:- start:144 stop:590 length:447 start_codon:yes stop_codon:yes gene_type:complete